MSVPSGVIAPEQDSGRRLGWGLRTYAPVTVVAVIAAVLLSLSGPANGLLSPDPDYEASALVVARKLAIRPEQLPRAADALFGGGSIADAVADGIGEPERARTLIPDDVRLEPVSDTIALRVIGRDPDPDRAAELANLAAGAFVAEFNALGEGVGEFVVQDEARAPDRRPERGSPVVPLAVGLISGTGLGLGLVGLILMVRRPLIDPREAGLAAGAPLLCTLQLPSRRSGAVAPEQVSGLALLGSRMLPGGSGVSALVGCGRDLGPRLEVLRLLALHAASRTRAVYLIVAPGDRPNDLAAATRSEPRITVLQDWFLEHVQGAGPPKAMAAEGVAVLFALSAAEFDVPQLLPPDASAVVLVLEGLSRPRLERATSQFGPGALEGIVFVRRRRMRRPAWSARRPAGAVQKPRPEAETPADVHRRERSRDVTPGRRVEAAGGLGRGDGQPQQVGSDNRGRSARAPEPDDRRQREPRDQRRSGEVSRPQ